jgi:hypothetical protein
MRRGATYASVPALVLSSLKQLQPFVLFICQSSSGSPRSPLRLWQGSKTSVAVCPLIGLSSVQLFAACPKTWLSSTYSVHFTTYRRNFALAYLLGALLDRVGRPVERGSTVFGCDSNYPVIKFHEEHPGAPMIYRRSSSWGMLALVNQSTSSFPGSIRLSNKKRCLAP